MNLRRLATWAMTGLAAATVAATIGVGNSSAKASSEAPATASAEAAAPRVTGVVRVVGVSIDDDSEPTKRAVANCPLGKRVLGGGGAAFRDDRFSTEGRVILSRMAPFSELRPGGLFQEGFKATAQEWAGAYSGDWTVGAYAICADPLPNQKIVNVLDDEQVSDRPQVRKAVAVCPSGTRVVGAGGGVSAFGGTTPDRVSLRQVRPNSNDGKYVYVEGIAELNHERHFYVNSYAVCATAPAGWRVEIDGTDYSYDDTQTASATCEIGERLIGAGFTKGDSSGRSHVDQVDPHNVARKLSVRGGNPTAYADRWNLAAWAICVTHENA